MLKGFFQVCIFRTILGESLRAATVDSLSDIVIAQLTTSYRTAEENTHLWWPTVARGLVKSDWRSDVTFLDPKEKRIVVSGGCKHGLHTVTSK